MRSTKNNLNSRVQLALETWSKRALAQTILLTDRVDENFAGGNLRRVETTSCGSGHSRHDLTCKVQRAIQLAAETASKWFCHVDDDTFVNFEKLEELLATMDSSKLHFIGKQSIPDGIQLHSRTGRIHFATGGAGWCLSKPLVNQLRDIDLMEEARKLGTPDDVTLGAVVGDMGVSITEVHQFHSHLEGLQWLTSPETEITLSYPPEALENGDFQRSIRYASSSDPTGLLTLSKKMMLL
ncbi:Oidioi.mRNA.OKI2018_I69.chr1.g1853.t1.cds [Oikopleura dioica]|uniref:Oidioi.mRNA.OKI2018_I69.chr1.g1853.t1.cds n=1 Tax=Oikopleura dioica TaxID=34765 RepID=A0ABN7STF5_OIKDI|nr:Oidioi.mRNA.OKI2018_I69.chr1.g1853.t1.cds [Oikopleura dioica]